MAARRGGSSGVCGMEEGEVDGKEKRKGGISVMVLVFEILCVGSLGGLNGERAS
jgi:hypothetical protein